MKKTLLILTVSLFTFSVMGLKAQDDDKGKGKLGVRAGWQNAATYNNSNQSGETINTFYAGVFRNNKLAPIIAIQTGLEYFQTGWYSDDANKSNLHYLSVPIGLRVKIGPVFAVGGPALNFKVSEKTYLLGNEVTDSELKSNIFDLPLFLGVGAKIAMFTVEARYHWGMIDVNDAGNRNQYFQLGAGISF